MCGEVFHYLRVKDFGDCSGRETCSENTSKATKSATKKGKGISLSGVTISAVIGHIYENQTS